MNCSYVITWFIINRIHSYTKAHDLISIRDNRLKGQGDEKSGQIWWSLKKNVKNL